MSPQSGSTAGERCTISRTQKSEANRKSFKRGGRFDGKIFQEILPNIFQNPPKIVPKIKLKSIKNLPKIDEKSSKIDFPGGSGSPRRRPGGALGLLEIKTPLGVPPWTPPGPSWGRLGAVLVANMAPTWLPKRSRNRSKIEANI